MSNKKPSELAPWGKDQSMVVHAHKPGVSQKVSIQDIINAVPVPEMPEPPEQLHASEVGKNLISKESVEEIKEMLEIPEASEGGGGGDMSDIGQELVLKETVEEMKGMLGVPELQSNPWDTDKTKAMLVGAFGIGATGNAPTLKQIGHTADSASIPNGVYLCGSSDIPTIPEGYVGSTSNYMTLISFSARDRNGIQILLPYRTGETEIYIRSKTDRSSPAWNSWVEITKIITPVFDEIGTVLLARVLDGSKGTLNAQGFYSSMGGRAGLKPVGFDGSDMPSTQPYLNGTWTQISYANHDSEDPVARMALWRKIA